MNTKTLLSQLMLLLSFSLSFTMLSAQAPPVKEWDKSFGGSDNDGINSLDITLDGGYILGGYSQSGISGNKTADNKGKNDYWVVKIDSKGNKRWDRTYGGSGNDILSSLQHTSDSGYILGGSVSSTFGGDQDYWIVKIDSNGNKQWDKTFGGNDDDGVSTIQQTLDGGYILGGSSRSGISGNKTEGNRGNYDYWIIKIDANGNKQWDKTFGGSDWDVLRSLQQTSDGGYIFGGESSSNKGADKTEDSKGYSDYWIVKIDANGNKQWDKTFGGSTGDFLYSLQQTSDGGYILGGLSYSDISGDKTEASRGGTDSWIIKINANGKKQWDKTFGGNNNDWAQCIQQTTDGGYLLGGPSDSGISGDKTENSRGGRDYWIVKVDGSGNKQWDKAFGGNNTDQLTSFQQISDGGYVLGGFSYSNISGDKTSPNMGSSDYWVVKLGTPACEFCTTPNIRINDVATYEGNSGQKKLKFRVHLSDTTHQTVTVDYTTVNNTAKAPGDYIATSGTLTFAPGIQNEIITVLVNGNKRWEPDQTFKVKLSHPVNATLKDSIGVGTILNDDKLFPCIRNVILSATGEQVAATDGRVAVIVSPNPASSVVNIRLNGFSGSTAIQLISLQGKVLKTIKAQGTTSEQFSVADLASGTYFLAVTDEKGYRQTVKLVVVH